MAEQLQAALTSRVLIEQAKGALMVHQDVDEATAFEWLRLSARSSSRTVNAVAQEILAGRWPPMPNLASVVGRLARARRTEQHVHRRAIEVHEQPADQHTQLGQEERAQAERDRGRCPKAAPRRADRGTRGQPTTRLSPTGTRQG